MPTTLHSITVDRRCSVPCELAPPSAFLAVKIHVFDVKGVDVAGYVAEKGKADIDE